MEEGRVLRQTRERGNEKDRTGGGDVKRERTLEGGREDVRGGGSERLMNTPWCLLSK